MMRNLQRLLLVCALTAGILGPVSTASAEDLLKALGRELGRVLLPDDSKKAANKGPTQTNQAGQGEQADVFQQLLQQCGGQLQEPAAVQRVTALANRLRPHLGRGREITTYVVKTGVPNAFALADGRVVVTAGMLELTRGDDGMLAAVVGHEFGHVECRHGQKQGLENLLGGLIAAVAGDVGALAAGAVLSQRSQSDEFEADACGMRYMLMAGYDPDGAMALQKKLVEITGSGTGVGGYFSSHPPGPQRVCSLRERLPGILLDGAGKLPQGQRPVAVVVCDREIKDPPELSRKVCELLNNSGQISTTDAGVSRSADRALRELRDGGAGLLVWCGVEGPKEGPWEHFVEVYDVPTGLVLTRRRLDPRAPLEREYSLAVLGNRNWRHGGSG